LRISVVIALSFSYLCGEIPDVAVGQVNGLLELAESRRNAFT
jgi:hypothetical protein